MRWNERPGPKVEVPRQYLETLADHMAEPEKWLHMLREHSVDVQGPLDQYAIVPV